MTEYKDNNRNDEYREMSIGKMTLIVLRLFVLLLWKLTKRLLRLIIKGVLFLIDLVAIGWERLVVFWNSNSTQEKLRKFRHWLKCAFRSLLLGIIDFFKCLFIGIVVVCKKTVNALMHIGPTLRKTGRLIINGYKGFLQWCVDVYKYFKIRQLNTKRAYRRFRHNAGFKGLLIDIANSLRGSVTRFMDEDETDNVTVIDMTDNADDDSDDMEDSDEIEEMVQPDANDSRAKAIGKKIISQIKEIVDEDR